MKNYLGSLIVILSLTLVQCKEKKNQEGNSAELELNQNYTMDDFKSVPKIDIHVHISTLNTNFIDLARTNNFKLLNVTVDHSGPSQIERMQEISRAQKENHPDIFDFGTAFSLKGWNEPNWSKNVIERLELDFDKGANSVKTWKNIGMEYRDNNGDLIFLDHPQLDAVFDFIQDQGKIWLSHAGEPLNCWLPLDSMTVKNDRDYFKAHPKYHMFLHPEQPSHQDQIDHRDNRLVKNPDFAMIAVHMASLEWDVEEVSNFLDRFPNAHVDLAERMSHTQHQSQKNRKKVRDFFIKYQDRVIYGTDLGESDNSNPLELERKIKELWENDWKYFNTDELFYVPQLNDPVRGLSLPREVVDKIYYSNARKLFPNGWQG
ncbi:amidohydrolase family protein [Flagellimonas algicola]|uniref:Amidohydrolase n=1 Tax=Flagellimonas algicola TaxID=2583815 RepID=A0ABY2WHI9_9FLAO|nr:amidohydrolase family protein [Allomuricauda algicola]TMU50717.1 amidohydrolase [Allomuricauda algicola]